MKIIFLDIDGVLNVIPQGRDEFGSLFHKHFEDNLKFIIEKTNAKIVISSTWRMSGLDVMQEMWNKRNLAGEIIDVTPMLSQVYDRVKRGHEIDFWIKDNPQISNYVIIDDDNDMLEIQKNNFVRTANNYHHEGNIEGYGLTKECANMVIQILCT